MVHKSEYLFFSGTIQIAGWFIYAGKLNNFENLSNDIKALGLQAIESIEFGVYSDALTLDKNDYFFIDKMGLSLHFLYKHQGKVVISATLQTIKENFALTTSNLHESILEKRRYLFGTSTKYQDVVCIPPGGVVSLQNGEIIAKKSLDDLIKPTSNQIEQIPSQIKSLIESIPKQKRSLALSGGT
ncbi:hypothetical protein MTF68_08190 [Pseudoalteromonas sp. 2CM37A]|uniref:hypothetical protein n=1 Tax=Pseudoalteromonas sp. 2CM37A TaxID=2929853 RepID=UPI0020BF77AB|nr:hypothetical protein [Pseudoalteromonas sp. 2CM37A]MCK8117541.1 hypothetical protein [Pseudoalteromonas sp. 2CM37A]